MNGSKVKLQSSASQAESLEATAVGSFELLSENAAPAAAADRQTPLMPLAADEWATFMDARGRISDPPALWARVYRGGVAPGLRKEVWPCPYTRPRFQAAAYHDSTVKVGYTTGLAYDNHASVK